jgi:3-carboxy-cis,cis-muconate cycloisomerase
MAHKQNPVKAEVLVTLARYNASLLSALHNAAVHEQERSGAAWTLEWLVLPQMICAAAGAARVARDLLESVESIGS